ncbi:MAG: response regulator transcription factor [Deltaproteobacteria bacterium]|nr:response regulator transcription factor [Kofleriaceae bacterium]
MGTRASSEGSAAIRVALIDDHALFREGLRLLFERRTSIEVVGEAATARAAIELGRATVIDVALLDVSLPESGGAAVTHELRRLQPACAVLALSMHEAPARVAEMLRAGATGYAFKTQDPDALVSAVECVHRGNRYLAPGLVPADLDALLDGKTPLGSLSPREREVFDLLVRGLTNDRIGAELFIAPRTVETHRQHIMSKLHVHSIVELVRLAAREGLLEA